MGLGRRSAASPEARKWMGNLLVAWTFVTGLSAAFASAWYGRTGDLKILIAYLGAPFLVGVTLFTGIGVYALATREKRHVPVEPDGQRVRNMRLHGRAVPSPTARRMGLAPARDVPAHADPASWERVTLRFRPAEDDLAELNRLMLELRHARVAVAVLAVAAAVGWAQLLAPEALRIAPYGAAPLALLVGGIALLAALLWRPRRLARRTLRRETILEATWRVGPEGIEVVDARGRGRYHWTAVERVRETSGIFVVDTSDGGHHVISKRSAGSETIGKLRAVLRAHAGDRVALRAA